MSSSFPDPFSEAVVDEVKVLIAAGEVNDLTTALDAQINSVHVPEWYQSHRISRIYGILLELRANTQERTSQNKILSLLKHIKSKYRDKLIVE